MSGVTLSEILRRFAASDCSWLTTVRPDSRPHAAPIWHVWSNGRAYIVTKPTAVKVGNIGHNPHVVITHPDPHSAIIIDGLARIVQNKEQVLRPLFKEKYDWDILTDVEYNTIIEIMPTKVLAWGEEGAAQRRRWSAEDLK
jgi:nitroimidazol reductase NimA-like FMN-containing flavoprotein (pyridoxamine 5'-phosphate oxidase superfamily)